MISSGCPSSQPRWDLRTLAEAPCSLYCASALRLALFHWKNSVKTFPICFFSLLFFHSLQWLVLDCPFMRSWRLAPPIRALVSDTQFARFCNKSLDAVLSNNILDLTYSRASGKRIVSIILGRATSRNTWILLWYAWAGFCCLLRLHPWGCPFRLVTQVVCGLFAWVCCGCTLFLL